MPYSILSLFTIYSFSIWSFVTVACSSYQVWLYQLVLDLVGWSRWVSRRVIVVTFHRWLPICSLLTAIYFFFCSLGSDSARFGCGQLREQAAFPAQLCMYLYYQIRNLLKFMFHQHLAAIVCNSWYLLDTWHDAIVGVVDIPWPPEVKPPDHLILPAWAEMVTTFCVAVYLLVLTSSAVAQACQSIYIRIQRRLRTCSFVRGVNLVIHFSHSGTIHPTVIQ